MVYLGGFCLLVSMIGLYILLFSSFSPKQKQTGTGDFIKKAARKIRIHKENSALKEVASEKPNPQFVLLLESIVIGELVGLFFLWLSHHPVKFRLLAFNAAFLLVASFLCSVLTLLNAWMRKKTHLIFRIMLQATTLIIGMILYHIATNQQTSGENLLYVDVSYYMRLAVYGYFITVVVAISTMLYIAIKGSPEKLQEFEFSEYLMLVIMSGLMIGSGLVLFYSIKFFGF